jgi:hypothetical protein
VIDQTLRDQQLVAAEIIGCALATLRRLDHVCYDGDIRATVTEVRSTLSVAQSKIRAKIDEAIVERTTG